MKIKFFTPILFGKEKFGTCKSFLLLVLTLVMFTSKSYAQASFENIGDLRYLIDSDAKTATVVASDGDKYSGDIVVPEKVKASDGNEYPVTAFGDKAFESCSNLTSIIIPSSVTSMGDYCFKFCSNLTNITIPSSVTSLGTECFYYCFSFTNITIPSSITSLRDGCFQACERLTSITIPSSITSLGKLCFYQCYKLTGITIPSSVTSLREGCFQCCHSLTNITIPSSVTHLENSCFEDCFGLTSVTIPSSVTYMQNKCFANCSSLTNITIPSSITRLGYYCFENCNKLESATFKGKCPKATAGSSLSTIRMPTTCIIYVPKTYLQDYKDEFGSTYKYIYAFKDDEPSEDKQAETCATPSITYAAGKLRFTSSTPNAVYHNTITNADVMTDKYIEDGVMDLSATYNISVYATAEGYKPSEKATATLYWINANLEVTTPTNINQAKTRGIIATSHDGIVTLSGLENNEEVRFYAAGGKQIGRTTAIDGVASQAVTSNSLVIAKIGTQSIKIAVK